MRRIAAWGDDSARKFGDKIRAMYLADLLRHYSQKDLDELMVTMESPGDGLDFLHSNAEVKDEADESYVKGAEAFGKTETLFQANLTQRYAWRIGPGEKDGTLATHQDLTTTLWP